MSEVNAWLGAGDPVAVATVISTWGSAPRPAGSRMAISQSGKIAGSVSGGCLEGEVFEQAQAILKGKPASLFHYGVSDELAWTVGLSCGGEVVPAWSGEVLKGRPMDGSTYVVMLTHDRSSMTRRSQPR